MVKIKEYFLGMMKLWIILGVHHNSGIILGVISIHYRAFYGQLRYRIGILCF